MIEVFPNVYRIDTSHTCRMCAIVYIANHLFAGRVTGRMGPFSLKSRVVDKFDIFIIRYETQNHILIREACDTNYSSTIIPTSQLMNDLLIMPIASYVCVKYTVSIYFDVDILSGSVPYSLWNGCCILVLWIQELHIITRNMISNRAKTLFSQNSSLMICKCI